MQRMRCMRRIQINEVYLRWKSKFMLFSLKNKFVNQPSVAQIKQGQKLLHSNKGKNKAFRFSRRKDIRPEKRYVSKQFCNSSVTFLSS